MGKRPGQSKSTGPAPKGGKGSDGGGPTLLLSIDFEDWHQLVRRRVGCSDWERPGPALSRQTDALLALLDELKLRATFFILGMAARAHPGLIEGLAARGHEIGCHGDRHLPVHSQSPGEFASDLRAARATIEQLTGRVPIGYRAPAFSITGTSDWAYDVLAAEGFAYDASAHDTPSLRDRPQAAKGAPHPLELPTGQTLWEFPVAVWHARLGGVPIGGASYWAVLPSTLVLRGLERAGPLAGLYVHPHELDPQPLRPQLGGGAQLKARLHASARAVQRNSARRRAPAMLRAIARRFRLIPYGDAHAQLSGAGGTAA
ncbi:MAG: polysaccharide deacetylase family protein [Solirubrobacterales bacterium]|nr:polysaccharide deacetylase family protein [Solirubrobacterales bacterium]